MGRTGIINAVPAIVLIAFISAFAPAVADAQPVVLVDEPFADTQPNPCIAGELVDVVGRRLITVYSRSDGAGGFHLTIRFITKAQGTGVTSPLAPKKNYVLNEESVFEQNFPANATTEQTTILNHALIRTAETDGDNVALGTGEDFMLKETAHTTMHGFVPVVTITKDHARCM